MAVRQQRVRRDHKAAQNICWCRAPPSIRSFGPRRDRAQSFAGQGYCTILLVPPVAGLNTVFLGFYEQESGLGLHHAYKGSMQSDH